MKKKIYLIIVVFLCTISVLIVFSKNIQLRNKQKEYTENVIEHLETGSKERTEQINITYEEKLVKDKIIEPEESILSKNSHKEIGIVIIPSIEIKAPIYEGTSKDVLKYTVRAFYRNKFVGTEMLYLHHIMEAHMLTIFQILTN